jgi:hypothetical protein
MRRDWHGDIGVWNRSIAKGTIGVFVMPRFSEPSLVGGNLI